MKNVKLKKKNVIQIKTINDGEKDEIVIDGHVKTRAKRKRRSASYLAGEYSREHFRVDEEFSTFYFRGRER